MEQWRAICAIIAILLLDTVALINGIDGVLFLTSIAIISGLGGAPILDALLKTKVFQSYTGNPGNQK